MYVYICVYIYIYIQMPGWLVSYYVNDLLFRCLYHVDVFLRCLSVRLPGCPAARLPDYPLENLNRESGRILNQ